MTAPAPAGAPHTPKPCPACGHWGPRIIACADPVCRHGDVAHELRKDGTRGRCTYHNGASNTRCPCQALRLEAP